MWLLAAAVFAGVKWLTWSTARVGGAPAWRHAAYLLAWPGLDADAFLRRGGPVVERPRPGEYARGAVKVLAGAALLWGLLPRLAIESPLVRGWIGMTGLILVLHFGSFHLLSCLWRSLGVEARPLMDRPLLAASPGEFWGRRWNTAFRDLTHRFLFRPLAARWGPRRAIAAGFLASGLVHDLVISVPAAGGYGLPTAYFLVQGGAILGERTRAGRALGIDRGVPGRLYTALAVAAPAPILFHPPFVRDIMAPFLAFIGAGPSP
jgi:alginate O-acetyltransferase complex protein AlgI